MNLKEFPPGKYFVAVVGDQIYVRPTEGWILLVDDIKNTAQLKGIKEILVYVVNIKKNGKIDCESLSTYEKRLAAIKSLSAVFGIAAIPMIILNPPLGFALLGIYVSSKGAQLFYEGKHEKEFWLAEELKKGSYKIL